MKKTNEKKVSLPKGWFAAGSGQENYEFILDEAIYYKGTASGSIKAKNDKPSGFGTLMQDFSAEKYRGKRMKFSAFVKSHEVEGWAGLWMRVEGAGQDVLGFDNMKNRSISGTTDWTEYAIVLDVPQESKLIGFGILLSGQGSVWIDDVTFKEVEQTVPVTNMEKPMPLEPTNLDFEDDTPLVN
jgi:hypothetical protein